MNSISKDIFLNAIKCHYMGWALRSGVTSFNPTLSERFLFEQGRKLSCMAENSFS